MTLLRKDPFLRVVLFQPEIAQNMGTIVRLCGCFGVFLDVIQPCGFPFSSKALKRAALDYSDLVLLNKHVNYNQYLESREQQKDELGRKILLTTRANKNLWDFKFKEFDSLIFGNESSGASDQVHEDADARLIIPMVGGGRSLNLAVSVAVALGEAMRQLSN